MKNKEKYAKEIVEIACSGDALAVSKVTGKPISCKNTSCGNCKRCNDFPICEKTLKRMGRIRTVAYRGLEEVGGSRGI